ncbi:MAG: hypothetical protein COA79_23155 [Planctomycetota bacterium]|nr:MAG: hypothetical protein COA79_23155 [Planctomycetota bacterium]
MRLKLLNMFDSEYEPTIDELNESLDYVRSAEGRLFSRVLKDPNDYVAKDNIVIMITVIKDLKMKILLRELGNQFYGNL